ncbi:hypothetical protein C5167_033241 [Papaver somniferum]|uniref:RING-type E3 ubiquitin transferase n=1 Tax=Papaver somniferum TaxID=3469 RepID=A0A4Y7K9P0_PAPSO|nr:E3 ubiquitin-protein ligase ORTHRUS 1-like isoform X2 [Papaver somniferum]RZC68649.1 hypothetical protein C5167_033241 [Papaver somniferum]
MATEEFQSPQNHKNVVHRDIIISPGFRSVAAMAGWDEEALLAASEEVAEDTPEKESSKSPQTYSIRKRRRYSPVTNPVLVLNLDDEARATHHDGPVAGKEERKQADPKSEEMPPANLPCMREESSCAASGNLEPRIESLNKKRKQAEPKSDETPPANLPCTVSGNLEPQIEFLKEKREQAEPKSDEMPPAANLPCMDKLKEELSCAICLEICYEPSTTPCGHSFCKKCLKSAADKCGKKCPKCRQLIGNGRSCIVNTSLWNTIQLLFPQEVEARKAVAAKNSREQVKAQSTVGGEDSISRRRSGRTNSMVMMTNPSNIRVSSSSGNQSGRSNFTGNSVRLSSSARNRRDRPSQAEDAALALRLQREEFMAAFRAAEEASTARENLRALASRAVDIRLGRRLT